MVLQNLIYYGTKMSSKLEEKLTLYEKSVPVTNDEELISAVEAILDSEEALPHEQRDYDLIEEATEVVLSLQGVDIDQLKLDAKVVREKAVPQKKKKIHIGFKWLVPLVAMISLLSIMTIGVTGWLENYHFTDYKNLEEKTLYTDEDSDFIMTSDYIYYYSFDEFLKDDVVKEVLLPHAMFDKMTVNSILVADYGEYISVDLKVNMDGKEQKISVETPRKPGYDFSSLTTPIGNFQVWVVEYDGMYSANFEHEGSLYTFNVTSYEILENLIKCMEEQK